MRKIYMILSLCCVVAFLPACGKRIEKKVAYIEDQQTQPVNCATAQNDIKVLTDEKAHVVKQIAAGVMSITPPGLIMGILTLTEEDKIKMAIGEYNRMIDERIAQIKTECGLE